MEKVRESFRSINNRRMILVADDEEINREILGAILGNDYEILYAEDGADTMNKIRENRETLSLVLLDVLMPVMSGLEVLKAVKADETLSRIPVIVTTAEKETEIESLQLGAIDFIPKPYPPEGVVRARIQRTIELSEDRDIIQFTERDELTGLYNKEYFLRYVGQLDQHHKEQPMDALILDINHFRMINERYGRAYGDEVLRKLGRAVLCVLEKSGGIAGRREADTFLVYCPHRDDYAELLEKATDKLLPESSAENRVRLRLGVYSNVDKSIEIERRFDRAKMAADIVRGNLSNNIGYYDDQLHQRQIYAEQLIEDFPAAIAGNQFQVYYQPKFDVRPDTPVLASAEALVRWIHPVLGMISPG
ncbi:MAG: response regulator, partial [Lachnospiraceae bacterium]|nr:response regulator [Lachnospiraceae bacterium]